MSNWSVYLQTSALGWSAEPAIPRPNQDMDTKIVANMTKIKLADGSNAFIVPEVKRNKEAFTMFFADTSLSFRTQFTNYIINGDVIKILTHSGETFIGVVFDMSRVWFTGLADTYDVQITMEQTE